MCVVATRDRSETSLGLNCKRLIVVSDSRSTVFFIIFSVRIESEGPKKITSCRSHWFPNAPAMFFNLFYNQNKSNCSPLSPGPRQRSTPKFLYFIFALSSVINCNGWCGRGIGYGYYFNISVLEYIIYIYISGNL